MVNTKTAVFSGMIKFQGLLYELGISPHQNEVLSIKIDIDTNPPPGACTDTTILLQQWLWIESSNDTYVTVYPLWLKT
jgi:hypothetical protein